MILKHNFWIKNAAAIKKERQRNMLILFLDGFEGKLTSSNWVKIGKCSQDTATRDIQDLMEKEILFKLPGGG